MGSVINRISFYLTFIYMVLVLLFSSHAINERVKEWLGIHPLEVLFYLTLLILLLGIIGFSGIQDWKSALRSIFTVGFILVMSVFLAYIIFVGNLAGI